MNIKRENKNKKEKGEIGQREDVNIWFCGECKPYHIKSGSNVINFNKQEFSEFVNETWNCFFNPQENNFSLQ